MKLAGYVMLYIALVPGLVAGFVGTWVFLTAIGQSPTLQTIGNWFALGAFVSIGLWFVFACVVPAVLRDTRHLLERWIDSQ